MAPFKLFLSFVIIVFLFETLSSGCAADTWSCPKNVQLKKIPQKCAFAAPKLKRYYYGEYKCAVDWVCVHDGFFSGVQTLFWPTKSYLSPHTTIEIQGACDESKQTCSISVSAAS